MPQDSSIESARSAACRRTAAAGREPPLVTVVVPTRNRANLVLGAAGSVWKQTYRPLELVIVDDGSTDDTEHEVKRWAAPKLRDGDFNVRYIRLENSRGANAARNAGIRAASASFIAFLDSDDRWLPEKLRKQMEVIQTDERIGAVYCGIRPLDLKTGQAGVDPPPRYPEGWLLEDLIVRDVTAGTPSYVVRRDCFFQVGYFDETLPARQDWDMWIRLATRYQIAAVPEVLVEAGSHAGDRVRGDPRNAIAANWSVYRKYAYLRAQMPLATRLAARSELYSTLGGIWFHSSARSIWRALGYHLLAVFTWPVSPRAYLPIIGMLMTSRLRGTLRTVGNNLARDARKPAAG